jgi:hypothetical protein
MQTPSAIPHSEFRMPDWADLHDFLECGSKKLASPLPLFYRVCTTGKI